MQGAALESLAPDQYRSNGCRLEPRALMEHTEVFDASDFHGASEPGNFEYWVSWATRRTYRNAVSVPIQRSLIDAHRPVSIRREVKQRAVLTDPWIAFVGFGVDVF